MAANSSRESPFRSRTTKLQSPNWIICSSSGTNPNGSTDDIAGVCDPTGRVFGLMPHPERFLRWENHPRWTREARRPEGDGVRLFRSAITRLTEN